MEMKSDKRQSIESEQQVRNKEGNVAGGKLDRGCICDSHNCYYFWFMLVCRAQSLALQPEGFILAWGIEHPGFLPVRG